MSEAKLKERVKQLEIALQDIISTRGVRGTEVKKPFWDAIERARAIIVSPVGQYGRIISFHSEGSMPGYGASVKILVENKDTFEVEWFVNAGQPIHSTVPKNYVEFT